MTQTDMQVHAMHEVHSVLLCWQESPSGCAMCMVDIPSLQEAVRQIFMDCNILPGVQRTSLQLGAQASEDTLVACCLTPVAAPIMPAHHATQLRCTCHNLPAVAAFSSGEVALKHGALRALTCQNAGTQRAIMEED